jgi:hypothetical protein
MQADGYKRLLKKAVDDRTKQLLAEIGANELSDARSWSKRVEWLADGEKKSGEAPFLKQRVSLMMGILGTKGFFEWAIIAEDEAVEDFAIQAANIGDLAISEEWTRIASDERLHMDKEGCSGYGRLGDGRWWRNKRCHIWSQ